MIKKIIVLIVSSLFFLTTVNIQPAKANVATKITEETIQSFELALAKKKYQFNVVNTPETGTAEQYKRLYDSEQAFSKGILSQIAKVSVEEFNKVDSLINTAEVVASRPGWLKVTVGGAMLATNLQAVSIVADLIIGSGFVLWYDSLITLNPLLVAPSAGEEISKITTPDGSWLRIVKRDNYYVAEYIDKAGYQPTTVFQVIGYSDYFTDRKTVLPQSMAYVELKPKEIFGESKKLGILKFDAAHENYNNWWVSPSTDPEAECQIGYDSEFDFYCRKFDRVTELGGAPFLTKTPYSYPETITVEFPDPAKRPNWRQDIYLEPTNNQPNPDQNPGPDPGTGGNPGPGGNPGGDPGPGGNPGDTPQLFPLPVPNVFPLPIPKTTPTPVPNPNTVPNQPIGSKPTTANDTCGCKMSYSLGKPWELGKPFVVLFKAIVAFLIKMFMFLIKLPTVEAVEINYPMFTWFKTVKIGPVPFYETIMTLVGLFMTFGVFKVIRRITGGG